MFPSSGTIKRTRLAAASYQQAKKQRDMLNSAHDLLAHRERLAYQQYGGWPCVRPQKIQKQFHFQ